MYTRDVTHVKDYLQPFVSSTFLDFVILTLLMTHDTSLVPRPLANVNGERQTEPNASDVDGSEKIDSEEEAHLDEEEDEQKMLKACKAESSSRYQTISVVKKPRKEKNILLKFPRVKACRVENQRIQETRTMLTKLQRRLKFWQIIHSLVSKTCF